MFLESLLKNSKTQVLLCNFLSKSTMLLVPPTHFFQCPFNSLQINRIDGYKINRKKTLSVVQGFFIHRVAAATPPGIPEIVLPLLQTFAPYTLEGKKQKTSLQQCSAFTMTVRAEKQSSSLANDRQSKQVVLQGPNLRL